MSPGLYKLQKNNSWEDNVAVIFQELLYTRCAMYIISNSHILKPHFRIPST